MPEATVPQAFALALEHHKAGRLVEAEALYRQILAAQPAHAEALHHLGLLAHQAGRSELAVQWIRQAIALAPEHSAAHANLGEVLRAAGRLDEAIASLRRALELKPGSAPAFFNLGNVLQEKGQIDEAIATYRQALQIEPGYVSASNNLGIALAGQGRFEEAVAAYDGALRWRPDFPDAHTHRGVALARQGRLEAGLAAHRRALEIKPDHAEAWVNLANALREAGEVDEAVSACRRALAVQPDLAEAQHSLGAALTEVGRLEEAVAAFQRALEINPASAEAQGNLGFALARLGRLDEAIAAHRRALVLKPADANAFNNLGNALRERGQFDEAEVAYLRAIEIRPDLADAHNNLGSVLKDQGRVEEAVAAYRRALELKPDFVTAHSNLVYTLHFHPDCDDEMIAEEQRRWNQRFDDPRTTMAFAPLGNNRDPERRLRVGYVSTDFRDHVIGRNLRPLFARHDRGKFEIVCYSGVVKPDRLTEEFRRCADQWRDTAGRSDDALAEVIRKDGVDILVDLTQHLAGNRLPVFARRPAPVQVSFAGYPADTGVEAIGNRFSDRYLERSDSPERIFLLDSFWCYDPCGMEVEVNESPAQKNGWVTFGCLNNFCKVNEPVLKLWARVLGAVRDSRLLLLCAEGRHRQRAVDLLAGAGVEARRVEFAAPRGRKAYLELYRRVDIALDTFPYNGHTTSLDAFWMGVPVISLVGGPAVCRAGYSQLSNVGLPELAAFSPDDYVRLAAQLARDQPWLVEGRRTLRARLADSPLMDAARFVREIENGYRVLWQRWCAGKQSA